MGDQGKSSDQVVAPFNGVFSLDHLEEGKALLHIPLPGSGRPYWTYRCPVGIVRVIHE